MTKQHKKVKNAESAESIEKFDEQIAEVVDQIEQAENIVEKTQEETASQEQENKESIVQEKAQEEKVKSKSVGTALALLALLVAAGVGGIGHYFANSKFSQVETQLQTLAKEIKQQSANTTSATVEIPSFETEKAQISQLNEDYQKAIDRIKQLENEQNNYTQQINALQSQVQKLGLTPATESSTWRFSEADFLLNNALRKVVLDNDIDTAKSLLTEADNVLSQISDPKVLEVRKAVDADLEQLSRVNQVNQHAIMQRLAGLANLVDEMPLVVNTDEQIADNGEVSDSINDWQKNLEKSADSFLSHFIRISDKVGISNEKAFIAPNQEIYLRENIRLRLQIAMMAVPRQQNELYKQSIEAVGSWVRSYFDVNNTNVKRFLKEVDELTEQSIYIDAPNNLQSLDLLRNQLNRTNKPIAKIQIDEEKALTPLKIEEKGEAKSEENSEKNESKSTQQ